MIKAMIRQTKSKRMIWHSSDYSHKGHRRKSNEDAVFSDPRAGIWCVADGMGGHEHGGMASQLLIETMTSLPLYSSQERRVSEVQNRIFNLNQMLYQKGQSLALSSHTKRQTIGCTFVILLSDGIHNTCLWAGDSRLYLLRKDNLYQYRPAVQELGK